jgi:tight adherence protein B
MSEAPYIYILAFLAAMLATFSLADLLLTPRDVKRRINRRLTIFTAAGGPSPVNPGLVRRPIGILRPNHPLARIYGRLSLYCRKAGLEIQMGHLALATIGIAAALWLVSMAILRPASLTALIANGAIALAASLFIAVQLVFLWLARKRVQRLRALEEQMPLALDVIVRAIRAGHPVISAVQLATEEMGEPLGAEFRLIVDETNYGNGFREALMNFARRTGSSDAHFFAVSVSIQSETGGNLAEVLSGLSAVIRSRATLAKRVKSLSSEGRASALLLSAVPIFLIGFMVLFNPHFYSSKFSDPIFWPTAACVAFTYLVGWYMIHRIISFRY